MKIDGERGIISLGMGESLELAKGFNIAVVPLFYIILGDMMPMR